MQNIDLLAWKRDLNYRKNISEQIKKAKLNYYMVLLNQSGLDEKTQRDMILKYGTGKNEDEWKRYVSSL